MFNNKMKIGEGEKYDLTKVSSEGLTKEERAAIEKKNAKMVDIYKTLDVDGSGDLNKLELANAMDAFQKLDSDGDGKLSKKERAEGAKHFNEMFGTDISGKDIKAFLKGIMKAGKGDEKESTQGVLSDYAQSVADAQSQAKLEAEAKAKAEAEAQLELDKTSKLKADEAARIAKEKAEKERLQTPTDYTVQPGETLTGLLTNSLKAQGVENPTAEQLKEAKEEFIKNNPNALHGKSGKEYLYMGDVVKIAGALEDKANAGQIKTDWKNKPVPVKPKETPQAKPPENSGSSNSSAPGDEVSPVEHNPFPRSVSPSFSVLPTNEFVSGQDYSLTPEEQKQNSVEKSRKVVTKRMKSMNSYPVMERLPNGYTKRDSPGSNNSYFDETGNRLTEAQYNKARGPQSRKINYMTSHTILEELPNGYTKRDRVGGGEDFYYDKSGNFITKEQYEAAKKSK